MLKTRKFKIVRLGAAKRLTRGDVGGRQEIGGVLEQPLG